MIDGKKISIPMLLFVLNGSDGTGFDKETWHYFSEEFMSEQANRSQIYLDYPHYIHHYAYTEIAKEIISFL